MVVQERYYTRVYKGADGCRRFRQTGSKGIVQMVVQKGLYVYSSLVTLNRTKDSAYFARFDYYGYLHKDHFGLNAGYNRVAPVELTEW